jgi:hypothetical protein
MQFDDPQDLSTAYLILRHLYDGEVIEWPIADDHPLRHVFGALEAQGHVARWDRMWPLHDRYRLTDLGIAAIEAVYRPAGAQSIFEDVRGRNLAAADRRAYLAQQGYDPVLWPLLHDPSTHWDRFRYERGGYHDWFWEDARPQHFYDRDASGQRDPRVVPYVVDLDLEARAQRGSKARHPTDHDVS